MPGYNQCVVYGCSNRSGPGIHMHGFPVANAAACRAWNSFVSCTRKDWRGHSKYSKICSVHFTEDSYEDDIRAKFFPEFKSSVVKLKAGAVPSIRPKPAERSAPDSGETSSKRPREKSAAVAKRKRIELVKQAMLEFGSDETSDTVDESASVQAASREQTPVMVQECDVQCEPTSRTTMTLFTQTPVVKKYVKGVQTRPKTRTLGIQHHSVGVSVACQTPWKVTLEDNSDSHPKILEEKEHEPEEPDDPVDDLTQDPDYSPDSDCVDEEDDDDSSDDENTSRTQSGNCERKFIVFESCLLKLFLVCMACGQAGARGVVSNVVGTMVCISQYCELCDKTSHWASQPLIGETYAGNILLSAAILFSGSMPTKTLRMLRFMGLQVYHRSTFFIHQRKYLHQAIRKVFKDQQDQYFGDVQNVPLELAGDARCDSMGHSAKYGSYTVIDTDRNKIVDVQLVQSNEVRNSYNMELEGLKRIKNTLDRRGANVRSIVTDRHAQVTKWIRENWEGVRHYFDIWHVAKGLVKKLDALAKKPACALVGRWIRSFVNHLYWSATSSNGNGQVCLGKWKSLSRHIANIHHGHGEDFPACLHPPIQPNVDRKPWFQPGTEVYESLCDVIESRQMLKDIPKLAPGGQTFSVEGYHSLVNHFAPKMFHFDFHGMESRILLAAIHHNENSSREQAMTRDGRLRYAYRMRKFQNGKCTVAKVASSPTYNYASVLTQEVIESMRQPQAGRVPLGNKPPPVCSQHGDVDKENALHNFFSRYR